MRFKIENAPTFVQESPTGEGKPGRSAFVLASVWLTKKAEQGLEPVAVVAVGHEARLQLFGDATARGPVVFRQIVPSTSATSATSATPSTPSIQPQKRKAAK